MHSTTVTPPTDDGVFHPLGFQTLREAERERDAGRQLGMIDEAMLWAIYGRLTTGRRESLDDVGSREMRA
jgi:hypothetical protein